MDFPYVFNYFLMLFFAYLYWKNPNEKYVKWVFFLQFIFIAFRAPVVGADTWNYVRYLDGERSFYNSDTRELECGFQLYKDVLVSLNLNRFGCMLVNSILTCYPVYLLIRRYSYNPPLSLALISIFNLYYLYFCGLRQILGLAILFMCIIYILSEKKHQIIVYVIGSIIGYLFHTSIIIYSVIFALAYYLRFILNRQILLVGVILSALIGIVLQKFNVGQAFDFFLSLNFRATERIQGYLENDEMNEITSIFFVLRPSIIAIIIFACIDRSKTTHWFTSIYFIGMIISNLFVSVPMVNRLTQGVTIFAPIVFTWIFNERYYNIYKYRRIVHSFLIIFILYFSQMLIKNNLNSNIDLNSSARMHPYQFIWEDYSKHPSIIYWGD